MQGAPSESAGPTPSDGLRGLRENYGVDVISGFLVFLIALPLCLGISMASGYPPFSGVVTAIVGGVVVTFMSGAPMTIKGPAAGLIVIAVGAVEDLGRGDAAHGYKLALAVGVMAGVTQIGFGLLRAGRLGDFFPQSAIHGMLAAIGIIIAAKQTHVALGVKPMAHGPVGLITEIPSSLARANPEIAVIGVLSFVILASWPRVAPRLSRRVPGPLVVLLASIPLGVFFDLNHAHAYAFAGLHTVGPDYLVAVPASVTSIFAFPDFSQALSATSLQYVIMFALVGSIESSLSAKAVDTMDPWRRKSNLDRDLVAVGIGNTIASLLGGLPMISEIVRSSANVQNGARTRWANFFHGAFLLACVALIPAFVHRIPLAALAAMLVYTGLRLASPRELAHAWKIGKDQAAIFVVTVVVTLATDLLLGVAAGVALKALIHVLRGVPALGLFRAKVVIEKDGGRTIARVRGAATFANYLGLRARLATIPMTENVVVDLSEAVVVDHTVQSHLASLADDRAALGGRLEVHGLHGHAPTSTHPLAARVRRDRRVAPA